ncbi:hypothetical protein VFPPC_11282 [Pochonia chlamydosporia 170]|uniref:DUF1772-domain-containing protein n=1 Tax=Pochonia chlamydosporia 170 TaxID=1380566 RepID=A0A179F0A9_METCM|nr:hypothetical protein VFPPC_11282 [Pochonia chlamydosporia 170]OAQ58533.1 hypothetical protein VFPPC_11282 [Pochonia chlamydosporia 170]
MSRFINTIPTAAYPLSLGLLVTSSLLFGNVGLSLCGPLPIIKDEIGSSQLTTRSRVRVWKLFFDRYYVIRGTAITIGLHLSAVGLTALPLVRSLSLTSAACSASAIVYTGFMIQPTNKSLGALNQKEELSETEDKEALRLIGNWDWLHKWRMVIYAGAWTSGVTALIATFA